MIRRQNQFGIMMAIHIILGKSAKIKNWMVKFPEYNIGIQFGKEKWWKNFDWSIGTRQPQKWLREN
mgnify:CR=1 FL=1